jgi:hypothetical protein
VAGARPERKGLGPRVGRATPARAARRAPKPCPPGGVPDYDGNNNGRRGDGTACEAPAVPRRAADAVEAAVDAVRGANPDRVTARRTRGRSAGSGGSGRSTGATRTRAGRTGRVLSTHVYDSDAEEDAIARSSELGEPVAVRQLPNGDFEVVDYNYGKRVEEQGGSVVWHWDDNGWPQSSTERPPAPAERGQQARKKKITEVSGPNGTTFDRAEIEALFNDRMPDGFSVSITSLDDEAGAAGGAPEGTVSVSFEIRRDGRKVGTGTRTFSNDPDDPMLYAAILELDSSVQGNGIAAAHYQSLIDLGRQMGYPKIVMHANIDVGGYAWARYGVAPADGDDMALFVQGEILGRLEESPMFEQQARALAERTEVDFSTAAARVRREWQVVIQSHVDRMQADPDGPDAVQAWYDLVDRPQFKDLYLGSSWYGELRLNDRQQMDRFDAYSAERLPRRRTAGSGRAKKTAEGDMMGKADSSGRKRVWTTDEKGRAVPPSGGPVDTDGDDAWIHAEWLGESDLAERAVRMRKIRAERSRRRETT